MSGQKCAVLVNKRAPGGWRGIASHYRLFPPMDVDGRKVEHVIVSAVCVPFSGPETYIFEADSDGGIVRWNELEGSFQGGLCHETALKNAGYELVEVLL